MPNSTRSGLCSSIRAASASAAGPPKSSSPQSGSVPAKSVVAPWAPSSVAASAASGAKPTASTVPPSDRALASSSSATGAGFPPAISANTQIFPRAIRSDHLLLSEEVGDALVALAVVLDDRPRRPLGCWLDAADALARGGATGAVETEDPGREPVERLRLGAHDSFERGVAGLVDPGGHAHDRGQPGLHEIVSGLGLALHLESRAVNLDRLREGDSGDIKELRDHLRDDAGVSVGRFGGGDHQVKPFAADRRGE